MRLKKYTNIDPNIPVDLLEYEPIEPICTDMVSYRDMYFSKDSFVKLLYIGVNGVFLLIPCKDTLQNDPKEQKRCCNVLQEVKETMELHTYIYPIFAGNENCYYAQNPLHPEEIHEPYDFLQQLYFYTSQNKTSPDKISAIIEDVMNQEELPEEYETIQVLDTNTIERVLVTVSALENNLRPDEKIRYDEDGTEYVLKDSDLMIGKINTGLIGKKKWFRVSDLDSFQVLYTAIFGGCLGLHKMVTHEYLQAVLYILTGGFGGILPAIDVLSICLGTYHYTETAFYQQDKNQVTKEKENIYLKKVSGVLRMIICIVLTLIIGLLYMNFIYSPVLELIIEFITKLGLSAGTIAFEKGFIVP